MAVDDLNRPLGLDDLDRGPQREIPWNRIGIAGLAVLAGGIAAFSWLFDDGMGGEPYAVARIEKATPPVDKPPVSPNPPTRPPVQTANDVTGSTALTPGNRATGSEIEQMSGVKIVRLGDGQAPGAQVIQIPNEIGIGLAPAPDQRLVERSRHGLVPKIGSDGSKPIDVYARPIVSSARLKPGAPRIALVVGGMGLNRAATQIAAERLPGDVTLGFAPYGMELDKQVAQVREAGHEVILQLPMESFDGASDAAGPHTLVASATYEENLDSLQWLMSRFAGYIGVANFLGGKFTSDSRALAPMMREIGSRGLMFFDDGTSVRSMSSQIAQDQATSFRGADVAIDADSRPEAIEAALTRLEALARQKGTAVGFASGLPATVDRLARFAKSLEGRGIALTPLSAVVGQTVSPTARNR